MDEDESDEEIYIRPVVKKTKTAVTGQAAVTDFFNKAGPLEVTKKSTALKPSGGKPAAAKKPTSKKVESDVDEEAMISEAAEVRPTAPTRAARGKTKKYIEIESDSDDDDDDDDDMYGE